MCTKDESGAKVNGRVAATQKQVFGLCTSREVLYPASYPPPAAERRHHTGLLPEHPGGRCHVFSRSVIEIERNFS